MHARRLSDHHAGPRRLRMAEQNANGKPSPLTSRLSINAPGLRNRRHVELMAGFKIDERSPHEVLPDSLCRRCARRVGKRRHARAGRRPSSPPPSPSSPRLADRRKSSSQLLALRSRVRLSLSELRGEDPGLLADASYGMDRGVYLVAVNFELTVYLVNFHLGRLMAACRRFSECRAARRAGPEVGMSRSVFGPGDAQECRHDFMTPVCFSRSGTPRSLLRGLLHCRVWSACATFCTTLSFQRKTPCSQGAPLCSSGEGVARRSMVRRIGGLRCDLNHTINRRVHWSAKCCISALTAVSGGAPGHLLRAAAID